MPAENNIYEKLLAKGVPKQTLHKLLHTVVLAQIKDKKSSRNFIDAIKKLRLNLLSGSALSLLKTLFIRKPKNPV